MELTELKAQVALGEDSRRQFKQDMQSPDALAAEMAAFANSEGGVILLGVANDGSLPGLSFADVSRLNQMISNVAAQHVRSPLTVLTENVELENGRVVIVLTVPRGIDKPYFDRNGIIWLKSAADKRRVNSKEELRRLFQSVDQFHFKPLKRYGTKYPECLGVTEFIAGTGKYAGIRGKSRLIGSGTISTTPQGYAILREGEYTIR